jgi:hypothetical protein
MKSAAYLRDIKHRSATGTLRAAKDSARPNGGHKPNADPTPEEIAAECAKIRAENHARKLADDPDSWMQMYREPKVCGTVYGRGDLRHVGRNR